jgi:DNA-binding NtrC family response regulator
LWLKEENLSPNTKFAEDRHNNLNSPTLESLSNEAVIGIVSAEIYEWGGKETILLVEDELFVRKATTEALELAGYNVLAAGNANHALEISRENLEEVDLLISDVVLPGKNGYELAAEFAARFPKAHILLISGYAEKIATSELSVHDKEYLPKPFSFSALLRKVREILDKNMYKVEASA